MNYLELLKLAAPEAIVVATALVVLTIGLTTPRGMGLATGAACLGLILAIGAVVSLPGNHALPGGMLVISPLNSLFEVICLVLAAFTIVLAPGNRLERNRAEYLAIILLATVGLLLLVTGEELLMIFIGLELTGLSLYVMTAFDRADVRSSEAALKYFLFGSTSSAFTLFGVSLVYGMTGSTALSEVATKMHSAMSPLLAAGIVMTLVGLAFKIAAAPFHLWAPDAYQAAPPVSAGFIASASKVAAFVVLGKIALIGFAPVPGSASWHAMIAGWTPLLAALSALSILIGNFVALIQTNVRRLLAYSAVAHAGYSLIGLVAGAGNDGFRATLFYITVYAFTLVGAFGVVAIVRNETAGDDITDFRGLASRSPWLAGCMTVFILSLAGIPPLPGFFGKFYLFSAALGSGNEHGLLWLVALALFGSLVSLYYYLIVIRAMFQVERAPVVGEPQHAVLPAVAIAILAALVLALGLTPDLLLSRIAAGLP